MWKFKRKRHHPFRTIPQSAEKPILQLAEQYPRLGQNGLQHELERMGIDPDPHELKLLLREHGHFIDFTPRIERRPGQWDTGWPYWSNNNPVDQMDWPEGEPLEHRFPYWGWASRHSSRSWFLRVLVLLLCLAIIFVRLFGFNLFFPH